MYNHNKAQQSKNRVHISWDILYTYIHVKHWDVIKHPLPNFNGDLVRSCVYINWTCPNTSKWSPWHFISGCKKTIPANETHYIFNVYFHRLRPFPRDPSTYIEKRRQPIFAMIVLFSPFQGHSMIVILQIPQIWPCLLFQIHFCE